MIKRRELLLAGAVISLSGSKAFADTPVNIITPGTVPLLQQPSSMVCWATVATMMYSWKNNASYDIDTVMKAAGASFEADFTQNIGLSGSDKAAFLTALSMSWEAPQDYTVQGWADLIQKFGPLWVTTTEDTTGGFSIHARVLTGMVGDGSPDGTSFTIADPADGKIHTETVTVFVAKYDSVASGDLKPGSDLRPQVVHF